MVRKILSKIKNRVKKYVKFRKIKKFIHLDSLSEEDKLWLINEGFNLYFLEEIGSDDISLEKKYLRQLGIYSSKITYDNRIPAFQRTILETGYLVQPCPICGEVQKSNQSFCVFTDSHNAPMFYRFVCCQEYYLIVVESQQRKSGLYFPDKRLLISFEHYVFPHRAKYYGKDFFESCVSTFFLFRRRAKDIFRQYVEFNKPKEIVGICCFEGNHGHQLSEEVSALQFVSDNEHLLKKVSFLVGPNDYFDVRKIFPNLNFLENSKFSENGGNVSFDLFKNTINNNLFCVRITAKELPEKAAQKIVKVTSQKCTKDFRVKVEESARLFPLIWITLRSHSRYWVGQEYGIPRIINKLRLEFPNIGVVFDGVPYERDVYNSIVKSIPYVKHYNALNCKIHETIFWLTHCTFFIGPYGNNTVFTSIANLPGVIHTHAEWSREKPFQLTHPAISRRNNAYCYPVKGDTINESGKDVFTYNYNLKWEQVYQEAKKLINSI